MLFTKGQSIQVKAAQRDDETGVSIAKWSGRIVEVHQNMGSAEIEWDSPTLYQMPDEYIRRSIDGGYDYFRYYIEPVSLEPISPKDTPEEVKKAQKALRIHYAEYEMNGSLPLPFSAAERQLASKTQSDFASAKKQLLTQLKSIEGSGSFAVSGTLPFTLPGLWIKEVGEIGFPTPPVQLKEMISQSQKAPFGLGSQTITDPSVRSAWEIDASQLSFHNQAWEEVLTETVKKVKEGLGIEGQTVNASLYKLLIYEEGDFFLAHQDSEKEPGMFATLVIGLPCRHSGGELVIRFDSREERVDFAPATSSYELSFAAFYADCEHEIKPVTSGYRVCLVYNLLQAADAQTIRSPHFDKQVQKMQDPLKSLADYYQWKPLAVLLGHQYTPTNFSLAQLKLHDRPRAEALMEAAEQAGYFANLGLVTLYQMGSMEGGFYYRDRRGRYYEEEEEEEAGIMGEIHEEYITIKHWGLNDTPGLGEVGIRPEDILSAFELAEEEPIEHEEEGYTGNAGMTIEYWYHYGAVILWPTDKHFEILASKPVHVRLEWIGYYLRHWEDAQGNAQAYIRQLLSGLAQENLEQVTKHQAPDFSATASAFTKLQDERFLKDSGVPLFPAVFEHIAVENWSALIQAFDPAIFIPAFQKAADRDNLFVIRHLTEILTALDALNTSEIKDFVLDQVARLPDYLRKIQLHQLEITPFFSPSVDYDQKKQEAATAIIENILALSPHKESDTNWIAAILERITDPLPRAYANRVVIPILLSKPYHPLLLARQLRAACIQDLQKRTAIKPTPPPDWKSPTPKSNRHQPLLDLLHPFLRSPTQHVFDFIKNESERSAMESAIRSVEIDLEMETIKKGRPYTLRLTKTQAAYAKKLKEWEEDVAFLNKLNEERV